MRSLWLLALALALFGCRNQSASYEEAEAAQAATDAAATATDAAAEPVADPSLPELAPASDAQAIADTAALDSLGADATADGSDSSGVADGSGLTYGGYDCTDDCSGHEAGHRWAEDHGIEDPDDCGGNSQSFIEGCRSYAEEQQAGEAEPEEESDESDGDY